MGSNTPYDDVFRTLLNDCTRLAIPLINEMFGESYPDDVSITLRNNEHFLATEPAGGKDREVISDSNLLIDLPDGQVVYHIECQSTPDGSMALRLFEYNVAIALEDSVIEDDGTLIIRFPRSGVIYLREGRNVPKRFEIVLQAPGHPDWRYGIEVLSISDYSLDALLVKKLLFLIPFHLFTYERHLARYNDSDVALAGLLAEYARLRQFLDDLALGGAIDEYVKSTIVDMTNKVAESLAKKYGRVVEGVRKTMGGQVLEYEAKTILREGEARGFTKGRAEGKAEGKAEGRIEALARLVARGDITSETAAEVAGMTVEEFNSRAASVA